MEEIIESYINGNYTQMVEQIKKYDPYTFSVQLEGYETISYPVKLRILSIYLKRTC